VLTNIAIIADKYLAASYKLVGVDAFPVKTPEEARVRLKEILGTGNHKIILLPEKLAYQLREDRMRSTEMAGVHPLFVIIPDFHGSSGERTRELYQIISKAVGAKLKLEE
jgi:vacuolar-type H+-ATPase subunit F/Vma7